VHSQLEVPVEERGYTLTDAPNAFPGLEDPEYDEEEEGELLPMGDSWAGMTGESASAVDFVCFSAKP